MLKVDLGELRQGRRLRIDGELPPEHPVWEGSGVTLGAPLRVRGTAEQRGPDVVVRARITGEALASCRRCVQPVRLAIDEDVVLVYRPGLTAVEAEGDEVYALADRARELDLSAAVRENVMLAVPQYVMCDEACRGLCPRCGTDRNRSACGCREEAEDVRWAALKRLSNE